MENEALINKDGELVIKLSLIMGGLNSDGRRDLMRYVWFESYFIEELMEIIVNGYVNTDDGLWDLWSRDIEKIRTKLLPLMDAISRETITALQRNRDLIDGNAKAERKKFWDIERKYTDLQHSIKVAHNTIEELREQIINLTQEQER